MIAFILCLNESVLSYILHAFKNLNLHFRLPLVLLPLILLLHIPLDLGWPLTSLFSTTRS